MRPGLRRTFEQYQRLIQDEQHASTDERRAELKTVKEYHLQAIEQEDRIPRPVQDEVYELQRGKHLLMEWLRAQHERIRRGEGMERLPGAVSVRETEGRFEVPWEGKSYALTLGQLIADLEWGKQYWLDPATVSSTAQKRYTLEVARRQLERLRDKQVELHESANPHIHADYKLAFHGVNTNRHLEVPGIIAEHLAYAFFKQLEVDGGTEYKVEKADPYHDAYQKIDLLFRIPHWVRGASIFGDEPIKGKPIRGVQLSIGGKGAYRKKRGHLRDARLRLDEPIDDVMLVFIDSEMVSRVYQAWVSDGRPPGGPIRYLTNQDTEQLVEGCLADLVSDQELGRLKSQARTDFTRALAAPNKRGSEEQKQAQLREAWVTKILHLLQDAQDLARLKMRELRDEEAFRRHQHHIETCLETLRRVLARQTEIRQYFVGVDEQKRIDGLFPKASTAVRALEQQQIFMERVVEECDRVRPQLASSAPDILKLLSHVSREALTSYLYQEPTKERQIAVRGTVLIDLARQVQALVPSGLQALNLKDAERVAVCVERLTRCLLWSRFLRTQRAEALECLVQELEIDESSP